MEDSDLNKTVDALVREVVLIESHAHEPSARFQTLRAKTELLKIDILKRGLENGTKSLARQAGFKSIARRVRLHAHGQPPGKPVLPVGQRQV